MIAGYGKFLKPVFIGLALTLTLSGCGSSSSNKSSDNTTPNDPDPTFPETAIMLPADNLTQAAKQAFITAKSGDVIVFPKGRFEIADTLTFDGDSAGTGDTVSNITVMGYGKDQTILDFSNSSGGDGIFIQNGKDIEFRDLGIYEANNNAIKLINTDGIILDSIATVWEGALDQSNGAYGIYPVQCKNILIQNTYVRGSADAGIYVGQSQDIVVRRNIAIENVAGIEIENSINADVYDNVAEKNTGGILVFDLPIGETYYGSNVRVFDNIVRQNNTDNFANTSDFAAGVHIVPPGTGVIMLASSDVEVYNNTISDHDTLSVAITSYILAEEKLVGPDGWAEFGTIILDGWKPVMRNINVHDNTISNSGNSPRGQLLDEIIAGYSMYHGVMPAIIYDGLGELLANAGVALPITGAPFSDGDYICASNNGDVGYGQVFGTDPTDPANGLATPAQEPTPTLQYEVAQSALFNCSGTKAPTRLTASQATINGISYGCASNDETDDPSVASCAL